MDQTTLTVITPIKAGQVDALSQLLNTIGDDIDGVKGNKYIRFADLATTHFARWVIIPGDKKSGIRASLAFESNFDGELDPYLEDLARTAGYGVDQIYSNCEGYPAAGTKSLSEFKKYVREHSAPYSARYIAYRGRSVRDTHNNTRLRQVIEEHLDDLDAKGRLAAIGAAELRSEIQGFVREQQKSEPGLQTSPLVISNTWRQAALLALIVLAVLLILPFPVLFIPAPWLARFALLFTPLLLLGIYTVALRRHEKADEQIPIRFVPVGDAIVRRENQQVQNQLTHLVEIKPGLLRLYSLKAVFLLINLAAKLYWYKGALGTIPTIHFARWVIIDDNKRLLFFSNFDGSWENYLGDFIDKAAVGLTGVWSNTVDFPRTAYLFCKGATDEERFKEWGRAMQIPTQVWYTAHADETVQNILDNFKIRNDLNTGLPDEQAAGWLQLF